MTLNFVVETITMAQTRKRIPIRSSGTLICLLKKLGLAMMDRNLDQGITHPNAKTRLQVKEVLKLSYVITKCLISHNK